MLKEEEFVPEMGMAPDSNLTSLFLLLLPSDTQSSDERCLKKRGIGEEDGEPAEMATFLASTTELVNFSSLGLPEPKLSGTECLLLNQCCWLTAEFPFCLEGVAT